MSGGHSSCARLGANLKKRVYQATQRNGRSPTKMSTHSQARRIEGHASSPPHFGHVRAKAAALRGAAYLRSAKGTTQCSHSTRTGGADELSFARIPEYDTPLLGGTVNRADAPCTRYLISSIQNFPPHLPECR
jgi:hypothetical protein